MAGPCVSIILPVYNEDGNIAPDESAAAIMAALASGGMAPPDAQGRPPLVFRFDRAEANEL